MEGKCRDKRGLWIEKWFWWPISWICNAFFVEDDWGGNLFTLCFFFFYLYLFLSFCLSLLFLFSFFFILPFSFFPLHLYFPFFLCFFSSCNSLFCSCDSSCRPYGQALMPLCVVLMIHPVWSSLWSLDPTVNVWLSRQNLQALPGKWQSGVRWPCDISIIQSSTTLLLMSL